MTKQEREYFSIVEKMVREFDGEVFSDTDRPFTWIADSIRQALNRKNRERTNTVNILGIVCEKVTTTYSQAGYPFDYVGGVHTGYKFTLPGETEKIIISYNETMRYIGRKLGLTRKEWKEWKEKQRKIRMEEKQHDSV